MRYVPATILLLLCFGGVGDVPVADANEEIERLFAVAYDDLNQLTRLRKKPRTVSDDLVQYLEAVGHAYRTQKPDRRWRRSKAYAKELARFRKKVENELFACLVLEKVVRWRNVRDDVNHVAARILGDLAPELDAEERERISRRIRQAVDKHLVRRKPAVAREHVGEAVFNALAELGSMDSIRWILDEHVHTDERKLRFLLTAHESLVRYEGVPGPLRYQVVKAFLRTYAPIEMFAQRMKDGGGGRRDGRSMMATRIWDTLGKQAVKVLKHYAKDPHRRGPHVTDRLTTMAHFEKWFRVHKDLRKAPWADPKV